MHPSEAGLHVPGLPLDAYQHNECKLKVREEYGESPDCREGGSQARTPLFLAGWLDIGTTTAGFGSIRPQLTVIPCLSPAAV